MGRTAGSSGYHFGLLGWPVGHSLSPAIHRAALEAWDLDGEYALYPAPPLPAGRQALEAHLQRLRQGDLHGLNVTIPHKRSVVPMLDGLSGSAEGVGAVNLIYRVNDRLLGDNSDAPAFMNDLQRLYGIDGRVGTALVLGAGGAARAAVYALLQAGWQVYVAARRIGSAYQLADDLARWTSSGSRSLTAQPLEPAVLKRLPACELVINATPVGMHPNPHETPWPADTPFPPQAIFYDMVYNPAETVLVKAARSAGLEATNGLGMLVEQAALSFECWTNLPAPRERMWEAAVASLSHTESPGPV